MAKVGKLQRVASLQTLEIKALETTAETIESKALDARGDSTTAIKLASSNLSLHQERQLADVQLCIVIKGIPVASREAKRGTET